MAEAKRSFRGIHYENPVVYRFCDVMKRGWGWRTRFRVAAHYVRAGDVVWDLCAGEGMLARFLPHGSTYHAVEASAGFCRTLAERDIPFQQIDLHTERPQLPDAGGVAVMLISLCHFRETSLNDLLSFLKQSFRRVIIVEEVLDRQRHPRCFRQRLMHFLCGQSYYVPVALFTADAFSACMQRHGYAVRRIDRHLMVGVYEQASVGTGEGVWCG